MLNSAENDEYVYHESLVQVSLSRRLCSRYCCAATLINGHACSRQCAHTQIPNVSSLEVAAKVPQSERCSAIRPWKPL